MILSVNNIHVAYRGRPVLEGLAMTVDRGQVLTILGPNGVGKTTLLRCINAILKPKTGTVMVENADVFRMSAGEIARQLGYVAQRNDAGRITAFDAVLLGRKPHLGWRVSGKDLRTVDGALKHLGLEHLAMRHLDEMSGGELQKVCIARALVQEPSVLLLDEPTSSLDLKNQMEILGMLRRVVRQHPLAAVMTMHDLNMALRFSDLLLFIRDGKVYWTGPKEELTSQVVKEVYGVPVDILRHRGHWVVVPQSDEAPWT